MKPLNLKEWLREQGVDIKNFITLCKNSGPAYNIYKTNPPDWISKAFVWGVQQIGGLTYQTYGELVVKEQTKGVEILY